jgi:magnesium and cobalt exporter, CNNM family
MLSVLILALAAVVAAVCAAADGAALAIAPEDTQRDPRLRPLVEARERTHRTLAFARLTAQLTAGASTAVALGLGRGRHAWWLDGLAAIVAAVVVVGLAEAGARAFGDAVGARAALALATTTRGVLIALAPVSALAKRLETALAHLLPPPSAGDQERAATAAQFRQVVAAEADVTHEGEQLLEGVFSLADVTVADIMVPRVDVIGIERDTPWADVLARVRATGLARFPVFRESLDQPLGVLYAKDLLPAVLAGHEPPDGWMHLLRPAGFIPTSKPIGEQLRAFQQSRTHLALVVDEYGGTAGLITIEDVLEEIVGEIRDERDTEDEHEIECEDAGARCWASGRLTLDALTESLGHDFRRDDVSTLGGLIVEALGRVPEAGEELTIDGYRMVVERVRRRGVARVYLERVEALAGRGFDPAGAR